MKQECDRCGEPSRRLTSMPPEVGRQCTNPPIKYDAVGQQTEANTWRALQFCTSCAKGRKLRG